MRVDYDDGTILGLELVRYPGDRLTMFRKIASNP